MAKVTFVARVVVGAAALLLPPAAWSQTLTTLHSFSGGTDGAYPYAGLLKISSLLYGTTEEGGGTGCVGLQQGCGTVFKIDQATGAETVLYSFGGGSDGSYPLGALINVGGTLFGTTSEFNESGNGTVFEIDPATGVEAVLHAFSGANDGADPFSGLLNVKNTLYGTTYAGGPSNYGTVFRINPTTGAEKVLHSFTEQGDAGYPLAGVIDVGGALYGTSEFGGASNNGTVFKIDSTTRAESVVYSFEGGNDGANPWAGLLEVSGKLYGTTYDGGTSNAGTVFEIDPVTGAETVLYSFGSYPEDGAQPAAALYSVNGILYGTTVGGGGKGCGGSGCGTVFNLNPTSGAETVLHSFTGSDGQYPHAALIKIGGALYGTTYFGGTSDVGTVFSLSLKP